MKFDLELFGEKEFYPKLNNKKYLVLKIDSIEKEQYMYQKFKEFINKTTNRYLAMDFEYNRVERNYRNIALMQINLEDETNIGMIFVIHPPSLKNIKFLLELLTAPNIIKILHGGESLDIPYLFNQLIRNKKDIDKFCNNLYDTKYMCDYMNAKNSQFHTSCSIYNLLESMKIISNDKLIILNKLADDVDITNVNDIDIMKLDIMILKYALYDVLFLPELVKKIINKSGNDIIYINIIAEITNMINKHKRGIENEISNIEPIIAKLNNYRLEETKINIKELWDIFNWEFNHHLKQINYFKKTIELITKIFMYSILIDNKELEKFIKWIKTYYPNFYIIANEYKNNLIGLFK